MDNTKRKKHKARRESDILLPPGEIPDPESIERKRWMEEVCGGFVALSQMNHEYYRVILELLWPEGHGIPGPHVVEDDIRNAVNEYRRIRGKGPYHDPFRRVRELQGEEGVIGILKHGRTYQLARLELAPKREPRKGLGGGDWNRVLEQYQGRCAVCGRLDKELRFDQDHKIPRLRGGSDSLQNWQPLCKECNNAKSTACRGCDLDCVICSWAFPEHYAPLHISLENRNKIRRIARQHQEDPNHLLNKILEEYQES